MDRGDNWIPRPSTYRIQSSPKVLDSKSKVHELIDWETAWWSVALLHNLFTVEERDAIMTNTISQTDQLDLQVWRCTSSGIFSVKSTYHLAKELEGNKAPESSRRTNKKPIWKRFWKFPIPTAAKNFLWRVCHNSLATKENLLRRKVVNEPFCPFCLREPETTLHALWGCPAASDVWGCSKVVFQKCNNAGTDFVDLAERIFNKCIEEDSTLFILLA